MRPPLQLACRARGIADQSCGIPRSPFAELHRYGKPRNTLDRRDHFANRIAVAIPQVERAVRETLFQGLQCQDMGLCQVGHVDVVTNACPIGRLVVGAENRDGISISACGIQNERHQVRFGIVVLADLAHLDPLRPR